MKSCRVQWGNGRPARSGRGRGPFHHRSGFTLVEVLVALTLVSLVLVPAVLHMQRLLRADRDMESDVTIQLHARENPPVPSMAEDN